MRRAETVLVAVLVVLAAFIGYLARETRRTSRHRSTDTATAAAPAAPGVSMRAASGTDAALRMTSSARDPQEIATVLRTIRSARDVYLGETLAGYDSTIVRWHPRSAEPIRVWIQPSSTVGNFRPEWIDEARAGFVQWQSTAIPVRFTFVDDSTRAELPLVWIDRFSEGRRIGLTHLAATDGWVDSTSVTIATHAPDGTPLSREYIAATVLHEVGHVLGLGHTRDSTSIMVPAAPTHALSNSDLATVRLLYSLPAGSVRAQTTP